MSFNPQEVFASLQSFLGSGYALLAIVAVLSISLIKKVIGLLVIAGILFLIWFLCQDQILAALSQALNLVHSLG